MKLESKENKRFLEAIAIQKLKLAKKALGGICTYLSFSTEKSLNPETGTIDSYEAFNAVMKNDSGGKDRVIIGIGKPIHELETEDFESLIINLMTKAYAGEGNSETTVPSI
jgi:hypothetical protein